MLILKHGCLFQRGRMISVSCETEKPERDLNVPHNFQTEILPFSVMHSTSQITSELMVRKHFFFQNIIKFMILFI